jgi:hypothetical protein
MPSGKSAEFQVSTFFPSAWSAGLSSDFTFLGGYIFLSGFNAYILIALSGIDIHMPKRNDLEQKALHYVVNTGYQGVPEAKQSRQSRRPAPRALPST